MNILVIGSKGFIGSHCVDYFSSKGNVVTGCDILEQNEKNYLSFTSLGKDFSKLFVNGEIDCCINSAGSANVGYSYNYPEKDFELNVSLVINLLGAIKAHNPHCKFINFSSAAVYGNPSHLPINENAEVKPLSPYGYHKSLSEKLLFEYYRFFNLKTCSLRVFSAYGPGLKKQLFWDMYQKSLVTERITLYGTGKETRDFIYITDLIEAVNCVIRKAPFKGETINIASGKETTIQEAANTFLKYLGGEKHLDFNEKEKEGDPRNWQADISLLKSLDFEPKTDIKTGLANYSEWLFKSKSFST